MISATVQEIKNDPAKYVEKVREGETVVITEGGETVAEIRPIASGGKQQRPYGLCSGEFTVPDDFDAPLPESVIQTFEGE